MRNSRAIGHHFGAGLARVIGQRVDEAVVVVDQQQFHALPALSAMAHLGRLRLSSASQGAEKSSGLEARLLFFQLGNRIVEQRRAGAIARDSIAQMNGADQNAGIDIAIQRQHAHRAAVPAARVFFQILDGLRRGFLRRADNGHRPHVREKRVQRIEARLENAFHVIHGVENTRVGFDQPPADHLHRARDRHARFVVAIHVAAHGQLGFFLGGIEQLADVVGVAQRIARAARGSRNRAGLHAVAFHAHEHLRRRSDQLLVAQLQQKFVRAGAALLNPLEQRRRSSRNSWPGRSAAAPLRNIRPAACLRAPLPLWPCTLPAGGRCRFRCPDVSASGGPERRCEPGRRWKDRPARNRNESARSAPSCDPCSKCRRTERAADPSRRGAAASDRWDRTGTADRSQTRPPARVSNPARSGIRR